MPQPFLLSPLTQQQAKLTNPQVLAFVGDAVQTLYVRTRLTLPSQVKSGALHTQTNEFVKASGQNQMVSRLKDTFTPDEQEIFKRARNYKTPSIAKHASVSDYKNATGWEAVLGFLYVTDQTNRLNDLLQQSFALMAKKEE